MGFNQTDAHHLNQAKEMFGATIIDSGNPDIYLTRFPIQTPSFGSTPLNDPAVVLANGMMASMRFDQDMHLWVDVSTPSIPSFIEQAIVRCRSCALRLVVTHLGASSHAPGNPINPAIKDAVQKAQTSAQVWHPIARKFVPALRASI